MSQFRLLTRDKKGTQGNFMPSMKIGNLVSQLVSHFHVTLVHATVAFQVFQQQLHFNDEKFNGKAFPVLKRHNLDVVRCGVPKHAS